jgi:hypothetical protein
VRGSQFDEASDIALGRTPPCEHIGGIQAKDQIVAELGDAVASPVLGVLHRVVTMLSAVQLDDHSSFDEKINKTHSVDVDLGLDVESNRAEPQSADRL